MIDLTPLDVRKKRGDFRKGMRGYDPQEVDQFLELAAERMEELVKENLAFRERVEGLSARVESQEGREKAVQEALVTAQSLREEMREQSRQAADLLRREAEEEARRIREAAEEDARRIRHAVETTLAEQRKELENLERWRRRFLRSLRGFLEQEMDLLESEEGRAPVTDFDLDALQVFQRDESDPGEAGGDGSWPGDVERLFSPSPVRPRVVDGEDGGSEGESGPAS